MVLSQAKRNLENLHAVCCRWKRDRFTEKMVLYGIFVEDPASGILSHKAVCGGIYKNAVEKD